MKRREIMLGIGSVPAVLPLMARAQQPGSLKRVAVVHPATKVADLRKGGDPGYGAFVEELERRGYLNGKNLILERYSGEGRTEHYDDVVREVISTHPDAIWSIGTPLTRRFKAATSRIPIVAFTGDPVKFGLISSFARPGANITGVDVMYSVAISAVG